jgi:hypothetical protein
MTARANPTLKDVLAEGADAGADAITNLADPTAPQDAATKAYVDANDGSQTLAETLALGNDAGGLGIVDLADPVNPQDADTKAARGAAITALSTVYQPLDSDLTAIAALATTTFGRALLTAADAAALRTDAGLGTAATSAATDFDAAGAAAAAQAASQPLDSDLTAIAALTTTTYGRAFLALADAAAGRTALGLGTLATQSGTFSGTSSGTNTGDQTSVTGNAGTATALQTARAIDGQSFDGTAAITVIAPGTHAATSKATPVDADEMPLADSAASFVLKKLTWANLKAAVKAYTDTLYPSGSGTSSGTNTGDQTTVSGNAGTATKLATARNIDGQAFDGSAAITVIAPGTHAATSKTTPVDADELPLVDSAASNVLKKLTWANLKATLKTYLDTLYAAIVHTHAASDITSGTIAQARLGTGSGGAGTKVLYDDQTYKTPSGGGSLTSSSNYLSAGVTMTTANTDYDGPSLSLAAGTWLLIGVVYMTTGTTAALAWRVKLWDGTTVVSSARHESEGTAQPAATSIPVSGIVSPASTTTYKITVQSNKAGDAISLGPDTNGSYLLAVKIA